MQLHPDWCKPKDLDEAGEPKVKFKGSSIRDSKKEPRLRRFLMDVLDMLLKTDDGHEESLVRLYKRLCKDVLEFKDVRDWVVKKSVSKSILEANGDENARPHEKQPMDAINEAIEAGVLKSIQEGDKIWVYRAKLGQRQAKAKGELRFYKKTGLPIMEDFSGYRFPELHKDDHDQDHYLNRAYDTLMIIENLLDKTKFYNYSKTKQKKYLKELM